MSMGEAIKHATVNEESDRAHIVEYKYLSYIHMSYIKIKRHPNRAVVPILIKYFQKSPQHKRYKE